MNKIKIKKHDIFISYRREGGLDFTGRLDERLNGEGYSSFFDHHLKSGRFDEQLPQKTKER